MSQSELAKEQAGEQKLKLMNEWYEQHRIIAYFMGLQFSTWNLIKTKFYIQHFLQISSFYYGFLVAVVMPSTISLELYKRKFTFITAIFSYFKLFSNIILSSSNSSEHINVAVYHILVQLLFGCLSSSSSNILLESFIQSVIQ